MSSIYSHVQSKNHIILKQENKLVILLTYVFEIYLLKSIPIKKYFTILVYVSLYKVKTIWFNKL